MKIAVLYCIAAGVAAVPLSGAVAQGPVTAPAARSAPGTLERFLAERPRIDRTVTIDDAVAIALTESPLVRGAAADAEAAAGRLDAARAQTRPYISANSFVSGGSSGNIVSAPGSVPPGMIEALPRNGFADQNVSAMVPIYTSGRLNALVGQASALRDAATSDREAQRHEVILATRSAYRQIDARRAMVAVQQARLEENTDRLQLDRIRLQQEQIPPYYVSRDDAEVANAQQALADADRDSALALIQLKTTMGIAPESKLEVSAPDADDSPTVAEIINTATGDPAASGTPETELSALLRAAGRNRPELAAAAGRASGAAHGMAATRAIYGPQVNLFGMSDASKESGKQAFGGVTFGVTASIPLYSGGQREADLHTAGAERDRAYADEERVALEIAQDVESALLELHTADQNVGTARTALEAARDAYRAAEIRYEAGRSIVTEVLDSQAERVRAEGNLAQARLRLGIAQDQLLRAVGRAKSSGFALTPRPPLPGIN